MAKVVLRASSRDAVRRKPVIALDSKQIDVWLLPLEELRGDLMLRDYRALLSAPEREREQALHRERDRTRYVASRALVRLVLSRYAAIGPADWRFCPDPYGRPHPNHADIDLHGLSFNVSHAGSLIALAVGYDCALGIDTESLSVSRSHMDLAERFFAPAEVAALRGLPANLQGRRFFEYWTLKESYVKARGRGLSIPLHTICFDLESAGEIRFTVNAAEENGDMGWRFWQFYPDADDVIAVCAGCVSDTPPIVTVTRIVPQVSEVRLEPLCFRSTTIPDSAISPNCTCPERQLARHDRKTQIACPRRTVQSRHITEGA